MTETTKPRSQDTRQSAERIAATWRPASDLPEPTPQPGWVFRWIRTSYMNAPDPRNVSTARREGWVPCLAKDHPEIDLSFDSRAASQGSNQNIEIGGLMLCKLPTEVANQRDAYFQNATKMQTESVDRNYMRENDPRMPLFSDRKSSTSFGSGR
jgi:hypothetical protein